MENAIYGEWRLPFTAGIGFLTLVVGILLIVSNWFSGFAFFLGVILTLVGIGMLIFAVVRNEKAS